MARFRFVETCTSFPTYEIEAATLAEAVAKYQHGLAFLVAEPVEANYLVNVYQDDLEVPVPDGLM